MAVWMLVSFGAMVALIILGLRTEGGETLGTRQALYLGAFVAFLFGGYNLYQWNSSQTAPAEVEAYVPLYPNANFRTRVPVDQLRAIQGLVSTAPEENPLRGQWIFETEDSTDEVGKFYKKWSNRSPHRVGVDIHQEYSEMLVDAPNHSYTVEANNQWGKTRITYTLMGPLD